MLVVLVDDQSVQVLANKTLATSCDISAAAGVGAQPLSTGGGLPASLGANKVLFDNGTARGWSGAPVVASVDTDSLDVAGIPQADPHVAGKAYNSNSTLKVSNG